MLTEELAIPRLFSDKEAEQVAKTGVLGIFVEKYLWKGGGWGGSSLLYFQACNDDGI